MKPGFIAREILSGIRGNLSMFASIVLVSFVSFAFVSAVALLQTQISSLKDYWYERSQVVVYLCNSYSPETACPTGGITPTEQIAVAAQLKSPALASLISSYEYESQQEAFERLALDAVGVEAAEFLNAEQLNAAYWIELSSPESADLIVETLEFQPGVADVQDQRGFFDPIIELMNIASLVAAGIASVMLVSAALLTTTTIRLSAFSRRREIGIMRLVGASSLAIQLPFIIEALLSALVGAGLALLFSWWVVDTYVAGISIDSLSSMQVLAATDVWTVAPTVLFAATLLALISAGLSTARHVRV